MESDLILDPTAIGPNKNSFG